LSVECPHGEVVAGVCPPCQSSAGVTATLTGGSSAGWVGPFAAKYPGECRSCGWRIAVGDSIVGRPRDRVPGRGRWSEFRHAGCVD